MSGNLGGFDTSAPENNAANVLPDGEYPVVIVKADVVPYEKDQGKTLLVKLVAQILTPHEHGNKKIFQTLAVKTTNPDKEEWVKIGSSTLSSLGRSVNIPTINDTSEILNKPCIAKVKANPPKGGYDASNTITKFKPRSATQGMSPPAPAVPPIVQHGSTPNANSENPW